MQELDPSLRCYPDLYLLDAGPGEEQVPCRVGGRPSNFQQKPTFSQSQTRPTISRSPYVETESEIHFMKRRQPSELASATLAPSISGFLVPPWSAIVPLGRYLPHERGVHTTAALTREAERCLGPNVCSDEQLRLPARLRPSVGAGETIPNKRSAGADGHTGAVIVSRPAVEGRP